jgi:glyoxylase-like metal-dependent hydrolase (beta-lactamase superfamily II)
LTNCYLIGKKNSKAIVIDPGDDIDKIWIWLMRIMLQWKK